jgi:hypothetical protein
LYLIRYIDMISQFDRDNQPAEIDKNDHRKSKLLNQLIVIPFDKNEQLDKNTQVDKNDRRKSLLNQLIPFDKNEQLDKNTQVDKNDRRKSLLNQSISFDKNEQLDKNTQVDENDQLDNDQPDKSNQSNKSKQPDNNQLDRSKQPNRIELDLSYHQHHPNYCVFNSRGDFILYSKVDDSTNADERRNQNLHFNSYDNKIICVYSTKTKNNKWTCKKIYKIPENFELLTVSKHDQLHLFSNDYFYVWNMDTEKSTRIFTNKNKVIKDTKIKLFNGIILIIFNKFIG